MKRLVILTDNFLPRKDGISRFLSEIIPRIKDSYDIHLICPDYGEIQGFKSIRITKIPLTKKTYGDFSPAKFKPGILFREIKKADIVFTQTIGPVGGLGLFIAKLLGEKTISYVHSVEWELFSKATTNKTVKQYAPSWTKRLVRFLYGSCKELIVPSERIADMLTWQGIAKQKTVIHLGVDTTKFKKRDNHQLRAKLGFEQSDVVIGYHGRIAREKDIPTLLRAHIKLRKQYSQVKLLIVGSGVSRLISQIKKQPGVVHVPAVDDVEHYLNAMDIYCLPSLTETTSLSTLEAMSSELPVVTTSVGFVRDYVKEGKNGYFFKTGDSYDLAQKLEPLITHKSRLRELGTRGRELVIKNFDWDVTAERLINFFAANT
ncbi:MAG: glycosyltransferase family 4 protein [Nanoarchaeota archaeon]|nr:glycosyltransferase family 4 protein [Nanoarchaeota archaeon]